MRYLKCILAFLIVSTSFGQTNIHLVMNKGEHNIDKIDVFDLSQKEFHDFNYQDTLLVKFNKSAIDCYNIRCYENGKTFFRQIWLDAGNITIEAHILDKELVIDTVINSPFYYRAVSFMNQYEAILSRDDPKALNDFLLASFEENMDNPFSLHIGKCYVLSNQNAKTELQRLKKLTDKQGEKLKWFVLYPSVVDRINKILSADRINLPGYSFINRKNEKVNLSLPPGAEADYYVLDFWFLRCVPCVREHVDIQKKRTLLQNKKIHIISISTDRDFIKWNEYLEKHGYAWENYLQDPKKNITRDFHITEFPTYLILNKSGEIVETVNSFEKVMKKFSIMWWPGKGSCPKGSICIR